MRTKVGAVVAGALVAGLAWTIGPVGASGATVAGKKAAACALLTADEVGEIIGTTAEGPQSKTSVTGASVCDFDTGGGLGSDGGGLVVLQVYTGKLASSIYTAGKKSGEKVGSVYWDAQNGIATAKAGKSTIATSYTVIGVDVSDQKEPTTALAAAAQDNA